jgi:pyruvate,water dikinase
VGNTLGVTDVRWDPPGEGTWHFEAAHFPRPLSRVIVELFAHVAEGWITGAARYGRPATRMRFLTVNDYGYFGFGEQIPGDEEKAALAHRERWWNDEVRKWEEEERPAAVAGNLALQHEDLTSLDDDGMRDHLERCIANVRTIGPLHFEHLGRNEVITKLFEQCKAAGLSEAEQWSLFAGASAASRRPAELVAAIAEILRDAGVDEVASLDEVRAVPAAAAALDAYLDEYGWRVVDGYEPATSVLIERPEVVVASIRSALHGGGTPRPIPVECPPGIDEQLLAEARRSYAVRDDDDGICFMWTMGLVRRAVLEAGRRLEDRGRVRAAHDLFDATLAELSELLSDSGPTREDLAARADRRAFAATLSPPSSIGAPEAEPGASPDAPPSETDGGEPGRLTGAGIGDKPYRGRARVVDRDTDVLGSIEPGDVLIARMTGPAFNTVFPILGGVAVEEHGLGSHTGILARELGLPALLGVARLIECVADGDEVEIDPVAGTLTVLGRDVS